MQAARTEHVAPIMKCPEPRGFRRKGVHNDQSAKLTDGAAKRVFDAGGAVVSSGIFFALKRVRSGGSFHQATVMISAGPNGFNLGSLYADGDAMFLLVGGNTYGDGLGTAS